MGSSGPVRCAKTRARSSGRRARSSTLARRTRSHALSAAALNEWLRAQWSARQSLTVCSFLEPRLGDDVPVELVQHRREERLGPLPDGFRAGAVVTDVVLDVPHRGRRFRPPPAGLADVFDLHDPVDGETGEDDFRHDVLTLDVWAVGHGAIFWDARPSVYRYRAVLRRLPWSKAGPAARTVGARRWPRRRGARPSIAWTTGPPSGLAGERRRLCQTRTAAWASRPYRCDFSGVTSARSMSIRMAAAIGPFRRLKIVPSPSSCESSTT